MKIRKPLIYPFKIDVFFLNILFIYFWKEREQNKNSSKSK